MKIYCCNCKENINSVLTTGKYVYPHRNDLMSLWFHKCPKCGKFIGCHPNTKKPLGVIPTDEMKKARIIIHDKMDYYWKNGKVSRHDMYKMMSKELGIVSYHTGYTKSIEECRKVYRALMNVIKRIENEKY